MHDRRCRTLPGYQGSLGGYVNIEMNREKFFLFSVVNQNAVVLDKNKDDTKFFFFSLLLFLKKMKTITANF